MRSEEQSTTNYWTIRRSVDHSQKEENEVVWTRDKIQGAVKHNSAGNGAWREEERQTEKEMGGQHPRERQTEKEMGGQHPRVDGTKAERHHTSVRGQRKM
jgi:hypothetical protein